MKYRKPEPVAFVSAKSRPLFDCISLAKCQTRQARTVKYAKPEMVVLGLGFNFIEGTFKATLYVDTVYPYNARPTNPAYEADE